jgi:hypothetical protein
MHRDNSFQNRESMVNAVFYRIAPEVWYFSEVPNFAGPKDAFGQDSVTSGTVDGFAGITRG